MNIKAFLNTLSNQSRTLPIVTFYVTEGCNLQCIMCSYRTPSPNELSIHDIEALAEQLCQFGLRQIVYSGGEPLTRRDFPDICELFSRRRVRQTLLTNGLLLQRRSDLIRHFSEIIVSLDGSNAEIHDSIRGVKSFDQILRGLQTVIDTPGRPLLSLRTVIQKYNYRDLPSIVRLAKSIGVDRISFLAADVLSDAFARNDGNAEANRQAIVLEEQEIREFRSIVRAMATSFSSEFETGFISESPLKLNHIAQYFEALGGKSLFPGTQCNAPMISAVITSTGEIKPCFFLPAFGDIRGNPILHLTGNDSAQSTRANVRQYKLERCQTCVCTLYKSPLNALLDRF